VTIFDVTTITERINESANICCFGFVFVIFGTGSIARALKMAISVNEATENLAGVVALLTSLS